MNTPEIFIRNIYIDELSTVVSEELDFNESDIYMNIENIK